MGPTVGIDGTTHAELPQITAPEAAELATRFRPDIEGMRAVAVLLVVAYHAGVTQIGGGYVGVDVFFVISGFLITAKLFREGSTGRPLSVARFWAGRATRLLPASMLVLTVTMAATWLWLPPTRLRSINLDGFATALYAVNWRLAAQGVDYLNVGAPPSPLQHFWSLAVEEQFYLVWPVLLLALVPFARRRAAILATLMVLGAASLAISVIQTGNAAPWAYFGTHARVWELACGALLAVVAEELGRLPKGLAAVATWLGLGAVLLAAVRYTDLTPYPGYAAALPVGGAALMIAGGCAAPVRGVGALFGHRPFQFVGRLSYSWYLWHWPVLMIVPVALGTTGLGTTGLGATRSLQLNLILAAASLALAAVSFRLVEQPIRTNHALRADPRRGIALGLALTAGAAVIALVGGQAVLALRSAGPDAGPNAGLDTGLDAGLDAGRDRTATGGGSAADASSSVAAADPASELAGLLTAAAAITAAPARLRPTLLKAAGDLPRVYADGCHLDFATVTVKKTCVYGDVTAKTTVVLFGDSHAAQWFPALDQIARMRHWRLVSLTKSACPAASVTVVQDVLKRAYTECDRWRDQALGYVRALHPAMVALASLGTDVGGLAHPSADPDQVWIDGWLTTLNKVKQAGTKLVVLTDTPLPKVNVPDCISTHPTAVAQCAQSPTAAVAHPRRRQLLTAAATADGATVLDPLPWFCTPTSCPVIVGDVLVYKDGSHMSTEYSDLLVPVLAARLP